MINEERIQIYEKEVKGRTVEESTKEIEERRRREISPQATK